MCGVLDPAQFSIKKFEMPGDVYWIIYTAETSKDEMSKTPGTINGGMMKRKYPKQPFMNYIHVESIDKIFPKIKANGGKIIMPKQEIGKGMRWIAAFKDTEGNIMGLHEMTKKKK